MHKQQHNTKKENERHRNVQAQLCKQWTALQAQVNAFCSPLSLSLLTFSMFPFKVKHCLQVTFPFSLSEMSAYVLWGAILIVTNTYKSGGLLYRIAGLFLRSSFFPNSPPALTHLHCLLYPLVRLLPLMIFFCFVCLVQSFWQLISVHRIISSWFVRLLLWLRLVLSF